MQRIHWFIVTCSLCLWLGTCADAAELSAGTARVDLTPPPEMKAILGGYGARMSKPAEGVHDRVFAKALVISDGQRRCVVLTADILGFPPAFKPALLQQLAADGWTADQVLLLPSHSHTSIEMNAINPANVFGIKQIGVYDAELLEWTVQRCAAVISQAANGVSPVAAATSVRPLDGWNRNRRQGESIVDNSLTLTRIDTTSGDPLAVLVQFTAHPTFMDAEDMLFSGGWPGHLQRALEAMIGRGVNVMFYNGAEGDQSPVARPDSGPSRWEKSELFGIALAAQAHELWKAIEPRRDNVFDYGQHPIELPANQWHPDFMKSGGAEYGLSEKLLEKLLPLLFPGRTTSGYLRLGDLLIVGVPGEMSAELGLRVKEQARRITGAPCVTIGGLANEWISYILSEDQYRRGGYEASVSFYGPELGQRIVDGALAGLGSSNR